MEVAAEATEAAEVAEVVEAAEVVIETHTYHNPSCAVGGVWSAVA